MDTPLSHSLPETASSAARLARWRSWPVRTTLLALQVAIVSGALPFFTVRLTAASEASRLLHWVSGLISAVILVGFLVAHMRRARGKEASPQYKLGVCSLLLFIISTATGIPIIYAPGGVLVDALHTGVGFAFAIVLGLHLTLVARLLHRQASVALLLLPTLLFSLFIVVSILVLW